MPLSIDIIRKYQADEQVGAAPDFIEALEEVALVYLHKQCEAHGVVSLNKADFDAYQRLVTEGLVAVKLAYDENTEEVLIGETAVDAKKSN